MTRNEIADRVRANTGEEVNAALDRKMRERVSAYENTSYEEITSRIEELDREWDMERVLVSVSALVLGDESQSKGKSCVAQTLEQTA